MSTVVPRRLDHAHLLIGVRELASTDPDLARITNRYGPPPLWARRPGFATLVLIILEQQVSLASAKAVYRRVLGAIGPVTADGVVALGREGLRELGFTRQKAGYVHDLARDVAAGRLDLSTVAAAEDDEARRMLLAVRGIGPWTADIYRLMVLRRPDVWPDGDLALAEATRRIKGLRRRPSVDRLRTIARAWAPWRAVAARILWHLYLSDPARAPRR